MILYSIPGRCVIEIEIDTVVRLAEACPNICAIKEAGGDVKRVMDLKSALPPEFEILSGDDALTLAFIKAGGVGVISVASNLIPGVMAELVDAMLDGDEERAMELDSQYSPLFDGLLKLDTNPVPIKTALALSGRCSERLRLPLVGMGEDKKSELKSLLEQLSILS